MLICCAYIYSLVGINYVATRVMLVGSCARMRRPPAGQEQRTTSPHTQQGEEMMYAYSPPVLDLSFAAAPAPPPPPPPPIPLPLPLLHYEGEADDANHDYLYLVSSSYLLLASLFPSFIHSAYVSLDLFTKGARIAL